MESHAWPASFDPLARELSPPLLRYLTRYVGDAATADDLLQETLVRVLRGLPGFAGRSSVKTWAFSIATHVAADHFRRPENGIQIVELDEAMGAQADTPDVDEHLVIDEMNQCVRKVIASLPADYRAALVVHDLEGLTAQQTAEVCECSLATAKIRIHRARIRLKTMLRQECEFYRDSGDVLRCDRRR